ncbi:MAG: sensor domain-containing diguanylate cyclase [Candidatus Bipolaricaulota bacterium]|nr:sensor domain-containing diguanylate cyclase [Candidatus Bipolaricaulota bacterium]
MQIWGQEKSGITRDVSALEPSGYPTARRRRLRSSHSQEDVLQERNSSLYQALFEEAPIGLYITTADGTIVNANAELARMLGYPSRQTLIGLSAAGIYNDPRNRERVIDALSHLGATHRSEVELRTCSGAIILAVDTCCVVRDERGAPLYYQGCMQDVTEARRLEEQLRQMARHDPLTGVYNRHALAEILVAEAARSRRYGHPIGMLMIDVDRFKDLNDRLGHATGDEILKGIAGLIIRCVRDSDVVVRYGGDEFLVLLVETNGQAMRVKERIECEMAVQFGDSRYGAPVTVSIGATHWSPESGESMSAFLNRADKAMYAEKGAKLLS